MLRPAPVDDFNQLRRVSGALLSEFSGRDPSHFDLTRVTFTAVLSVRLPR